MTQALTRGVSISRFMRSAEFRRGVAEVRTGQPPDFDREDSLSYEVGRQFGVVAPRTMPIFLNGKLNPKAAELYRTIRIR
jgi:hypothetical protein